MTGPSRQDLQRAMQEAISRLSNTLPPIRLQLVPVASEVGVLGFAGVKQLTVHLEAGNICWVLLELLVTATGRRANAQL